jgi:hypothetical protein
MGKVTLGQAFLRALRFSPFGIISSMVHVYLHLNISFISTTRGRCLGTSQQNNALSDIGKQWTKKLIHIVLFFYLVFKCRAMHLMVMQSPASHHGNAVGPVSERFVVRKITIGFGKSSLQVLQVFRQY